MSVRTNPLRRVETTLCDCLGFEAPKNALAAAAALSTPTKTNSRRIVPCVLQFKRRPTVLDQHKSNTLNTPTPTQQQQDKMNLNGGQDWNEVVLRKKPQTSAQRKDEAAVNAVRDVDGFVWPSGLNRDRLLPGGSMRRGRQDEKESWFGC